MLLAISGLWGGIGAGVTVATAQLTNGGAVSMDCSDCDCSGTSDDGTISVFDNPSSGERVRGSLVFLVLDRLCMSILDFVRVGYLRTS